MGSVLYSCNKCIGVNKCLNYCKMHAGKALANYLNNIDVTETRIGEYSKSKINGVTDIVVSGHQLWNLSSPSYIYTSTSQTVIGKSPKFNQLDGMTANNILVEYLKEQQIEQELISELSEKIANINKSKMLIVPIKPGTKVTFLMETDKGKAPRLKEGVIKFLKWTTNKETYKLDCDVYIETEQQNVKSTKFPLSEYMRRFGLDGLNDWRKSSLCKLGAIEMTNDGIIKPIEVAYKDQSVVIDGTFMYRIVNGTVLIAGKWDLRSNSMVMNSDAVEGMKKTPLWDTINKNLADIAKHRVYIAPYNLCKSNVVKLEG